jgi:hypothetical protein
MFFQGAQLSCDIIDMQGWAGLPGQQSLYADILINAFPVSTMTFAGQSPRVPFRWSGMNKTWKPFQRDRN